MQSTSTRAAGLAVSLCLLAGCASHRPASLADRFMLRGHDRAASRPEAAPPSPSLEEAIGKTRHLMAEARPEPKNAPVTLESRDPVLAEALAALRAAPTAERYVQVGRLYGGRGLLDQAYDHYTRALRLDSHQADAYEGLARVWRDWKLPHLGLGDAYRAVYFKPQSAAAENTLGTILQALGRNREARGAYRLASVLDPDAGYPLSNLCYLSFLEGNAAQSIDECRAAIRRDPSLGAAHNNLALTYAAIGRLDLADREFAAAGSPAAVAYNMGVVYLARKQFAEAAGQFERAEAGHSGAYDAAARARQARARAGVDVGSRRRSPVTTSCVEKASSWNVQPAAPLTLEAAGLSEDLVIQLALKTLHFAGELTGTQLAQRLGLLFPVIEPALDFLIGQHQCEIVAGGLVSRASYRYRITDAGRARAMLFLRDNQYVGVAPVPVSAYRDYLHAFAAATSSKATRAHIHEAFAHLVISDAVLDQLGPAINARHSLFVYGPPGNGKTVISQAIRNVLDGEIAIPHAIEVDGSIVRIFDPIIHEPLPETARGLQLDGGARADHRWVRCRRPMVMVGGELRLESLDLSDHKDAGFYRAPIQTLANGGVLVIDDFGRQQCSPRELLNRWIVPLENRVDFLTLATGQKLELPFMVLVVFATNLQPSQLVDEAFLRRIQYKIYAQGPTPSEFAQIFENCCRESGIAFDLSLVERLLDTWYAPRGMPLRGCHPRDLIRHALALAEYLDQPAELTFDLLASACAGYFVHEEGSVEQTD